jgi:hypothetical protein
LLILKVERQTSPSANVSPKFGSRQTSRQTYDGTSPIDVTNIAGYTVKIDIEKVNFFDVVRDTYKTHAPEHGAFLMRPEKP